jgi:integrase
MPQVLSAHEMDGFLEGLTATTRYRDRAIVGLLKDGGARISEILQLRLADINWGKRILNIRATKTKRERLVPVAQEAITALSNYLRLERHSTLSHDIVFVNLGRRGFGQPFRYRSWVAICQQARMAASTPRVHAHTFRHTLATNMAESGMPLDALQRALGHSNMDTVRISVIPQTRSGRVAAAMLAAPPKMQCPTMTARPGDRSAPPGRRRPRSGWYTPSPCWTRRLAQVRADHPLAGRARTR